MKEQEREVENIHNRNDIAIEEKRSCGSWNDMLQDLWMEQQETM